MPRPRLPLKFQLHDDGIIYVFIGKKIIGHLPLYDETGDPNFNKHPEEHVDDMTKMMCEILNNHGHHLRWRLEGRA